MIETKTIDTNNDPSPTQLIRYQFGNHLGSASLELDDNDKIVSYEEYYPYGSTSYQAVDKSIKAAAKRYRYTGKERDEETGLHYHGARYYACWLGRWTSADPLGIEDGLELYSYARNHPISLIDPSGTQSTPQPQEEDKAIRESLVRNISEGLPKDLEKKMQEAAKSFSIRQLRRMRKAGLRVYLTGKVPPSRFTGEPEKAAGIYRSWGRHIEVGENKKVGVLLHELAHVWDDVRNDEHNLVGPKERQEATKRLLLEEKYNSEARKWANRADLVADPWEKLALIKKAHKVLKTVEGAAGATPAYFSTASTGLLYAYKRYLRRTKIDRSKSFDFIADRGYSMTDPTEFYAEGFAAYHGGNNKARLKLKAMAPELFDILKKEAKAEGIRLEDPLPEFQVDIDYILKPTF